MNRVQALVRHLRTTPGPYNEESLAREFELDRETVALAISHALAAGAEAKRTGWRTTLAQRAVLLARRFWAWALEHPARYFLLSAVVANNVLVVWVALTIHRNSLPLLFVQAALAFFLAPALHAPLAYARGGWRHGLTSAWTAVLSWFLLPVLFYIWDVIQIGRLGRLSFGSRIDDAIVALSLTLAALAAFSVVGLAGLLGSYELSRREASEKDWLSRRDLVRRLLEARDRLREAESGMAVREPQPTLWSRMLPTLLAPVVAVAVAVVFSPTLRAADPQAGYRFDLRMLTGVGAGLAVAAAHALALFAIGYSSGSLRWGVATGVLYFVAWNVADALGNPAAGRTSFWDLPAAYHALGAAYTVGLACVGSALRKVSDWRQRVARLKRQDVSALRQEVIDLEWRLAPTQQTQCVLAVDVKGSTRLKEGADPLVAEACFREYQELVRRTCERFGGKVHATAGDGAFVGFADAASAYNAALAVLGAMPEFNEHVNKLDAPFRLRVGIHQDEVFGELSEVQFSRALDVAAHIEGAAPVDGIAVSDAVAAVLPELAFFRAPNDVDGYAVYFPVGVATPATATAQG
jgi:class 3 adenylate cyclase